MTNKVPEFRDVRIVDEAGNPISGSNPLDTAGTGASAVEIVGDGNTLDITAMGEAEVTLTTALPAGTNNIGDVDVLTVPADPFGANADAASVTGSISAKLRAIATALGATALDLGSGTGGTRTLRMFQDTAQFAGGTGTDSSAVQRVSLATNVALPAGTNNIGDVDILSIAAGDNNIGNVDIVTLPALVAGTAYIGKTLPPDRDVTLHTNYVKKYYTNAGAVTDGIVWSPASGTRWHVVSMYLQISAAATITLEDDLSGGDSAVWKGEFAANQGMTIQFSEHYPLASGEDAADLLVTTSAGNIYVTITGYEI